jgi:hypothetical protein
VASDAQVERVRRHLANCQGCAHTARELDLVARGVASLLPVPSMVDTEVVHRFGAFGRALGRLLPFWDTGETAAAAKAGAAGAAAAAGGGGAVTAGGSLAGLGAAKLGVAALCAAGGYAVCDQIGRFGGPLPRERHHPAATAKAPHRSPRSGRRSTPAARAPAPIVRAIRQAPSAKPPSAPTRPTAKPARSRSTPSRRSASTRASDEFGFETGGSSAGASSPTSGTAARAASARPT